MLKGNAGLAVLAIWANGNQFTVPVPLNGFAEALAGKPIDNKEYQANRKKLMEHIMQRQAELREKLKAEEMKNLPPPPPGAARGTRREGRPRRSSGVASSGNADRQRPSGQHAGRSLLLRAWRSVRLQKQRAVAAVLVLGEELGELRVAQRLARLVGQQVLLGDVGDVLGVGVLREQVIVGLVLVRADILRDRQPPLLGVVELRIDVEDHAAERVEPVAHHLSDRKFRLSHRSHGAHRTLPSRLPRAHSKGARGACQSPPPNWV